MFLNIAKLQNNCEFKFLQNPDDGIETNRRTHYRAKVTSYRNQSIGANLGLQWVEIRLYYTKHRHKSSVKTRLGNHLRCFAQYDAIKNTHGDVCF